MTDFSKIRKLVGDIPSCGLSDEEINRIIEVTGTLPKVLLDYYREFGNYNFNHYKWVLERLDKYPEYINSDKDYIIIGRENQFTCFYGIKRGMSRSAITQGIAEMAHPQDAAPPDRARLFGGGRKKNQ
jgi:hypothetical protein